ncbi:MAG: MBL fold metallo-hydrolase [Cellulomonadaceae bacterium]
MYEDDGTTATIPLRTAVLTMLAVGPLDNDVYVLTCRTTGARLVIDPAAEAAQILAVLADGAGTAPVDVVVTHRHHDHVGALAAVAQATGARVAIGAADADAVTQLTGVPVDLRLHHGDVLTVGALHVDVVALRGHTPGSVALALHDDEDWLFTGDSLFPGGPGRTTSPEDFARLMTDLTERVFDRFDDTTHVCPGHGAATTIGTERPHLDQWRARGW